ncbi:putative phage-type endonuclease [Paraburkholderia atlantica]|uniref:YqaJ viral recombinase family nuclease n=1 Tax=Paraburkholderia atlantica TaxID=2654982 RepID=UPI003D1E0D7B
MNVRDEWLAQRKKGIGGSDCAAVCNQSRYRTAYDVWLEKTGQADLERESNEAMRFGHAMEAIAASMFAQRFNVRLRRRNAIIRHSRWPFVAASVDRLIEGRREGFEAKNVGYEYWKYSGDWGEEGSDQVPIEHLLQTQHYLLATGFERWHLGAVVGGNSLKCYVIEPDQELHELILDAERNFWHCVETRTPPPFDYTHPQAVGLLKRIYPGTSGGIIDLPDEIVHWHHMRLSADEQVKAYQAASDTARAHILHMLGEAAIGRLPDGGSYRRKIIHRNAYTVDACDYTTLTYSKPKAGDSKEKDQ